jgi:hypothetical protein
VLQMALNEPANASSVASHSYPESARIRRDGAEVSQSMKRAGLGLAALLAGGMLLWERFRKR